MSEIDYQKRCLYRVKSSGAGAPEMLESVWAYSFVYPGAMHSTPGRYRIRITKLTGATAVSMFGIDPSEVEIDEDFFSMQAYVEKWTSEGWISCLDWMGNPDDTMQAIEIDLNQMFQAFITGVPMDGDKATPVFTPKPPKARKAKKKKEVIETNFPFLVPNKYVPDNGNDDDDDWI